MYINVNNWEFEDMFRSIRPDNFSYAGLQALFTYMEDMEETTGTRIELDVIAICCEYSEYPNITEYNSDYSTEHDSYNDIDETIVIPIDNDSFIIQLY